MKLNILKQIIGSAFILSISLGFVACDDYLDVRPKSEIPADLHFDRESGFYDQLVGVYTKMSTESMYARNMSYGLIEVLSQNYDLEANNIYRYAASYNYEEKTTKEQVDEMWTNAYNCIANLNLILKYIDKVDKDIFSDQNYSLYKGEALGLRAFLHLDMLRIFAPSYASNPSAPAIPYVTEYAPKVTEQSIVSEALDYIIKDLKEASTLLEVDSLKAADDNRKYYHRERTKYFNYYAAEATLARAYMYKGDKENALKHAEIVIEEGEKLYGSGDNASSTGAIPWTHYTAIETTYEYECDRTYSREHIFHLNINKMDDIVKYYFTSQALSNALYPSEIKADVIFEKTDKGYGNDYRMLKCFKRDGDREYLSKFWQYENGKYNDIFPLIRKTEAYYIAAEILKDSDSKRAVKLLNTVRSYRNLKAFALPETLFGEDIQKEIYKEYRKEFLGEGQLFFYYKRLNSPTIDGAAINANDNVYVLPMPDNEIDFGNRK